MKIINFVVAMVLGFSAAVLIVGSLYAVSYAAYNYFSPRYVAVDNKVFHSSQQYTDGIRRDFADMEQSYAMASKDQKAALVAVMRDRFSSSRELLSDNEKDFYDRVVSN